MHSFCGRVQRGRSLPKTQSSYKHEVYKTSPPLQQRDQTVYLVILNPIIMSISHLRKLSIMTLCFR